MLLILVQADGNNSWGHLPTKKICAWSNLRYFKMEREKNQAYYMKMKWKSEETSKQKYRECGIKIIMSLFWEECRRSQYFANCNSSPSVKPGVWAPIRYRSLLTLLGIQGHKCKIEVAICKTNKQRRQTMMVKTSSPAIMVKYPHTMCSSWSVHAHTLHNGTP